MFLRRKGWLRKEFDEKLLNQLTEVKRDWSNQSTLVKRSFEPSNEVIYQAKLVEAKYFFLFREAKNRKITIR